jgi:transcription elongation GreA/GreB family factor
MSKAFTKEEDNDAGVAVPGPRSPVLPRGSFRITARGAAWLAAADPRLRALLAQAKVLAGTGSKPDRAALGVTVRARGSDGTTKSYRIVTSEEQALTGAGCSVESPIGRALLGARVGEGREIQTPSGAHELYVIELVGDVK